MSAIGSIVLQNSANERSGRKNGQYQNPKGRFLESKFPIQSLIEKRILRFRVQNSFATQSGE